MKRRFEKTSPHRAETNPAVDARARQLAVDLEIVEEIIAPWPRILRALNTLMSSISSHPFKKGIGHFGNAPAQAVDLLGCHWYYNWKSSPNPEASPLHAEFVPMLWNGTRLEENLAVIQTLGAKSILGFNEPDNKRQSRISVSKAIALWPRLMLPGVKLGSPATTTASPWLDQFMAETDRLNLRVDFLCLHWYGDITRADAVPSLLLYLQTYWERYHLPIWLTEFSGADFKFHQRKTTLEDNERFIRQALPMLEALPYLERYAWYGYAWNPRSRSYPFVGVLDVQSNALTPIGLAYKNPHSS